MDTELQLLAEESCDRSMTYSFLARALADEEIPLSFLESLRAMELETGTELDAFAGGLAELDDDALEGQRRELAADHASALLGMSVDPVSPYESVHTSEKHLMMQEARDAVVAAYREQGFAASKDLRTPEDHISLELDFMAALCERLADAFASQVNSKASAETEVHTESDHEGCSCSAPTRDESDDTLGVEVPAAAARLIEAQACFVRDHLSAWVPGFCDELEDHAATPFYRGVSQMLRAFISDESEYLLSSAEVCGTSREGSAL